MTDVLIKVIFLVSFTGPTILFFQENAGSILNIEIRAIFYF